MSIPRSEHPKPQFERQDWINLNGEWEFEIDDARNGKFKGYESPEYTLASKIVVPFCPQSKLSGVEHTDFIRGVWYKRSINIPAEKLNGRVFLHFGAVDYETTVFVNGKKAGFHRGGYVSFKFDITDLCKEGENIVTVYAEDDETNVSIPKGKQSTRHESYLCFYTRTTGIWQTVWLEFTPKDYIKEVKYYTNIEDATVTITAQLCGKGEFSAVASFEGREMGSAKATVSHGHCTVTIPLKEKYLWEIRQGRLYDLELTFGEDKVKSYFGLREVVVDGHKVLINGKSVFQRLILDQGFYPDGIYTAPSDDALKNDIILSLNAGFDGARLHEKIFEERFLYHCDKLGYIVWGEFPDWGTDASDTQIIYKAAEWTEEINRDFNHPAIIGWCPHNERWNMAYRSSVRNLYELTKVLDPTRPCLDSSGGVHDVTDIFDEHNYDQNVETFKKRYDDMLEDHTIIKDHIDKSLCWDGKQPFFMSEYGGIKWPGNSEEGWGYGGAPKTPEEFFARFKGLTDALLDNPKVMGLCYTQLTDVEQEQNGVYFYDRTLKFDVNEFYKVLQRRAKIEE